MSQVAFSGSNAGELYDAFNAAIGGEEADLEQLDSHGELRLEHQRQALLSLRGRLLGDVAHTAEITLNGSIETTSASPDEADLASETFEQDLAISLMGNVNDTLDQIEAALQRIDDGNYGLCADCETKIPSARLEAIPYASSCVRCAARRERAV